MPYELAHVKQFTKELLDFSAYADHMRNCNMRSLASHSPDADYCTCGYNQRSRRLKETYELIQKDNASFLKDIF